MVIQELWESLLRSKEIFYSIIKLNTLFISLNKSKGVRIYYYKIKLSDLDKILISIIPISAKSFLHVRVLKIKIFYPKFPTILLY